MGRTRPVDPVSTGSDRSGKPSVRGKPSARARCEPRLFEQAQVRAKEFDIEGVTLMHTQGVIKNIIPAIASTNAIVAAACSNEVFKIVTNCAAYMDNNLMYIGGQGVYAPTFKYERNCQCIVCGAGVSLSISAKATLTHLMAIMADDGRLRLKKPSIRAQSGALADETLYMRGPLESHYVDNLERAVGSLVSDGAELIVTDPGVPSPCIRVILAFTDDDAAM